VTSVAWVLREDFAPTDLELGDCLASTKSESTLCAGVRTILLEEASPIGLLPRPCSATWAHSSTEHSVELGFDASILFGLIGYVAAVCEFVPFATEVSRTMGTT